MGAAAHARRRSRLVRALAGPLLLAGGAGASLFALAPPAGAVTSVTLYVVAGGTGTTCTGASPCPTIQDAITYAQANDDSDAVTIDVAAGPYDEADAIAASSLASLTISGAGASTTTVDAKSAGSVFTIGSGTVSISGLTITGGKATYGGGVFNDGTVTLSDDTISSDSATNGGGVFNNGGTATLSDDTISSDTATAHGGGVANYGTATLSDDTISFDTAGTIGGGVYNEGTATLSDDTISSDSATNGFGGGVFNYGTATLSDDTLSFDTAGAGGGGVYNFVESSATISDSILDSAGCSGTIIDGGYNVESDDSCGFGSSDVVNSSTIDLATNLAQNGSTGPETLAIAPDSSALDEVPKAACTISTDERGEPRPGIAGQSSCDAGAYELQHTPVTLHQGPSLSAEVLQGAGFSGQLSVEGASASTTGTITWVTTKGSPYLVVSPYGAVSAPKSTPEGVYMVSGTDSDPLTDSGTWIFTLTVGPTSSLSPAKLSFSAPAGSVSGLSFVVVSNSSPPGYPPIRLRIPYATLSGPGAAQFSIVIASDGTHAPCNPSTPLYPGQSCAIGIVFRATGQAAGTTDSATLSVNDTAANAESATLIGHVEAVAEPTSSLSPGDLRFSAAGIAYELVENSSTNGAPLVFHSPLATVSGAGASYFSIVIASDGTHAPCNPSTPLYPGQSCAIGVYYHGSATTTTSATLTVGDNASDTETATLSAVPVP
jgi:hypothetical protein